MTYSMWLSILLIPFMLLQHERPSSNSTETYRHVRYLVIDSSLLQLTHLVYSWRTFLTINHEYNKCPSF